MENIAHLPYNFQFCLCSPTFDDLYLPIQSPLCQCSQPQRARTVYNSVPNAVYPSSCTFLTNSDRCLSATFNGMYEKGQKLFLKVTIGNSVFSVPTWQKIPISRYRFNIIIPTAATEMQLTYVVQQRVDDASLAAGITSSSSSSSSSTTTTTTTTATMPTTTQKEIPTPPSFSFNNQLKDERIRKDSFLSNLSIVKFAKKTWNNMKERLFGFSEPATTPTTTTTTTPRPGRLTQSSVSDVLHLKTVPQVVNTILQKSIVDQHDPGSYDIEAVRRWTLEYHNVYRQKHSMVDFTYDSSLERAAQRWADHLGALQSCLVHEQPRVYGENLFFFGARHFPSEEFMAKAMTQAYYMEGYGYDYNRFVPMSYYKTGHFTQLVWKESRRIGVGVSVRRGNGAGSVCNRASANTYSIYIVVKYDPAGNFQTHNAYIGNVRPPVM